MYNIIKIELFWSLEVTLCHFIFLFILGFIAHIKITVNLRIFLNSLFWVLFQHTKYILRRDFGIPGIWDTRDTRAIYKYTRDTWDTVGDH